jgi:hypothetical protein
MMGSASGYNITKLWDDTDSALLPNDTSYLPQDPFLPLRRPVGPAFLDTEACLCQRQTRPGTSAPDSTPEYLWRCVGNQVEGVGTVTAGKWFRPRHDDRAELSDIRRMSIDNATNPPDTSSSLQWDTTSGSLVPGFENLSVWDRACTGENHTTFSTSFYRAVGQIERGELPVDAAPCWRPGAVPLQIQNVSHWQANGCLPGFLCAYYTCLSKRISTRSTQLTTAYFHRREQHSQLAPAILPPLQRVSGCQAREPPMHRQ